MSRLSPSDIVELVRLQRKILDRSALIDQLLEHEQFQGNSDETPDGYVANVARRKALATLLDDITMAARWMAAILNRND